MRYLLILLSLYVCNVAVAERQVVMFTRDQCPYCDAQKSEMQSSAAYKRETFRRKVSTRIAHIGIPANRRWVEALGIKTVPTTILVETDEKPKVKMQLPQGRRTIQEIVSAVTRTWPQRR